MEQLQSLLEQVGNLADASPAVRGAVVVGTALAAVGGVAWRLARGRPKQPGRTLVRVDAPSDQNVQVRTGKNF